MHVWCVSACILVVCVQEELLRGRLWYRNKRLILYIVVQMVLYVLCSLACLTKYFPTGNGVSETTSVVNKITLSILL